MSQQSIKHKIHDYFSFLANIVTLSYIFKMVYFQVNNIYNIDNIAEELLSWFEMWAQTTQPNTASKCNTTLLDLRKNSDFFQQFAKPYLSLYPSSHKLRSWTVIWYATTRLDVTSINNIDLTLVWLMHDDRPSTKCEWQQGSHHQRLDRHLRFWRAPLAICVQQVKVLFQNHPQGIMKW